MIVPNPTSGDRRPDQPVWYTLSHHDRYRRLQKVRRVWCRCHHDKPPDIPGRTITLDGTYIDDIPSFYLSLGEAVNGPNGYFGGGLDALSDCLNGGFGVLPPLTLRLHHRDKVREALGGPAWCRFHAELFQQVVLKGESLKTLVDCGYLGDGSPADIARWTATYEAAFAGKPFASSGYGSYFDRLVEVLQRSGVDLVLEPENKI